MHFMFQASFHALISLEILPFPIRPTEYSYPLISSCLFIQDSPQARIPQSGNGLPASRIWESGSAIWNEACSSKGRTIAISQLVFTGADLKNRAATDMERFFLSVIPIPRAVYRTYEIGLGCWNTSEDGYGRRRFE